MQIIPIASGKGGVGKSLIAANLAIALGQAGKRTVLVDLDLGGSNLHLILGVRSPEGGIGPFLSGRRAKFEDAIFTTEYPNLRFIPGDAEIPGLANLGAGQKRKLINRITKIDADFVVVDLGAGTSFNTVDFFLLAPHGIVVTTPSPTAIVNAYLFLKNAVYRLLHSAFPAKSAGAELLNNLRKDAGSLRRLSVPELLQQLKNVDPEGHRAFQEKTRHFRPRIILNMLEDPKDADKVGRLRSSCLEYLTLDPEHLGVIYRDDLQDRALASRIPLIHYKPGSVLAQAIYRIADKLIQLQDEDSGPLLYDGTDDGFAEAEVEAEADFNAKLEYVSELLHSGTLSTGDLIETIKNQQLEITQLRKQNMLYKSKLVRAMNQGFKP